MNLPVRRFRTKASANQPDNVGWIRNTLIWLSGADTDTLSRTPREQRKFVGLGGIVLTTAALAGVSFTFALSAGARAPLPVAAAAGVLWGLAIMNLDRWLVTATQRRPKAWQNVLAALPRLLMALIIGAVISTPLVLWLFQREIDAELNVLHQQRLDRYEESLRGDARFARIPALEEAITRNQAIADGTVSGAEPDGTVKQLQAQYDDLDKQYRDAQAQVTCEFDGTCGTKTRGDGSAYRQKLQVAQEVRQRRDEVKARLDAATAAAAASRSDASAKERASAAEQVKQDRDELNRLNAIKKAEQDRFNADVTNDRGLLARLEALSDLTGRNGTLGTAYLLLMIFITTIEVLPVLIKLLMNLGDPTPYDLVLEQAEKTDVDAAGAELDLKRNLRVYEMRERVRREEESVRSKVERQVSAEEDVHDRDVRRWRQDQIGGPPVQRPAGIVSRMRRRRRADHGYAQWPEEEYPSRVEGGTGTVPASGGSDDTWAYER